MSDFGKNLRALRKARGFSQMELGRVLHYGYTAVSNYENGRNEPSLDDLIRLADFFDVSIDELLGRKRFRENKAVYEKFCQLNTEEREKILKVMCIFS